MSHVANVEIEIKDLNALETACKKLGVVLKRGQKTWNSFYGQRQEQYGRGEHAITVPDSAYEIGVIKNANGSGFHLAFDSWSKQGNAITARLGAGLTRLKNEYTATIATRQLQRQGFSVRRTMKNGRIQLVGERS